VAVFQTFYVSRAATPFDRAAIEPLLARWRSSNERLGITGCLLLAGHCFAQVLEGERATVQALARRIAPDPRHREMRVLATAAAPSASTPAGRWATSTTSASTRTSRRCS